MVSLVIHPKMKRIHELVLEHQNVQDVEKEATANNSTTEAPKIQRNGAIATAITC